MRTYNLIFGIILVLMLNFVSAQNSISSATFINKTDMENIVTSGGTISLLPQYTPPQKSQAERDCINKKSCWDNGNKNCYSQGYVIGEMYCSDKGKFIALGIYKPAFIYQSQTGQHCNQSYECKTGICSDNVCLNITEQKRNIDLLTANLTKLAQENIELKQGLEEVNKTSSEAKETSKEDNNLINKIANLLKSWLGI